MIALAPHVATASPADQMASFAKGQAALWVTTPQVIAAIRAQNARHAALSQAEIDRLDLDWRAQIGAVEAPLIDRVVGSPVSSLLAEPVAGSGGVITEVFVMDNRGLNVAASSPTSDYWQGDEAKFSQTYPMGRDAVHVGDIELDESTQTYQGQVSMSVVDPESGAVIGAVTFGLNASAFF